MLFHYPKIMRPHRALQNSDIIECILQYFAPSSCGQAVNVGPAIESSDVQLEGIAAQKDWTSLAMCTRVSKAISGTAYRLLWRELPSLTPLLRLVCFPPDVERCFDSGSTTATEPLIRGWQRFVELASYVLRIIIDVPEPSPDPGTAVLRLARVNAGQPLLPAIQEIRCTGRSDIDNIIFSVAGPSLQTLVIRGDRCYWETVLATSEAVLRLLRWLPQRTPDLRSLCVYASKLKYSEDLGSSIRSLTRLRSLRIYWTSSPLPLTLNDYLSVISSLEDLHDLALPAANWGTPNIYRFPPLRGLRLQGYQTYGYHIRNLYPLTAAAPLESLEVRDVALRSDDERCVVEEYDAIIPGLLATCADTLTVVKLDLGTSHAVSIPASTFLYPLKQLRGLRVCEVIWRDGLRFGVSDLSDAAPAWPQLTAFVLSIGWWDGMDASPYFEDVVHFVCECPQLNRLQLPALACTAQGPMDRFSIFSFPIMHTLQERRIRSQDTSRLARLLRSLLPRLRDVDKALKCAKPRWRLTLSKLRALLSEQ